MNEALVAALVLDEKGGSRRLEWPALGAWRRGEGLLWIHLDLQAPAAAEWLRGEAGLDPAVADALIADDPRPRAKAVGDGVITILRGVNFQSGSEPEDMVSLRCWAEPGRLITACNRVVYSVQDVLEALEGGRGPRRIGELLCNIANRLVERIQDIVTESMEQVDALEEELLGPLNPLMRERIGELRRRVIALRRNLVPQRDALARLQTTELDWLDDGDRLELHNSQEVIARYIENLQSVGERAVVTQDELDSRLTDQLNRRTYVLSIVAAIFLPLGFLTGLLGINVGGIPGSDDPRGFAIVSGGLGFLVAAMIWIFRRNRWL